MEKETNNIIKFEFSTDQKNAIDLAFSGKSFFLTGKAGTGKSTVVKELKKIPKSVMLATTGIAASNIEGETLHSFFSIRPFGVLHEEDANWVKSQKRQIWNWMKTIIIDEVSMLRPDVLDCINWTLEKNIGRTLRNYQVIFVGDMKQLPPVYKKEDELEISKYYKGLSWQDALMFENVNFGDNWEIPTVELTEIKRQTDLIFIEHLNKVRESEKTDFFDSQFSNKEKKGIILCPYNSQVTSYNNTELNKLPGELITLKADKSENYKTGSTIAEEILNLKDKCKVMVLKNDDFFYNGYIGELKIENNRYYVDDIEIDYHTWYTYKYGFDPKDGRIKPLKDQWICQLPIKPAYALTIHKSQGLTFDEVTIDLSSDTFVEGQLYTALSRVKGPQGLTIIK